VLTLTDLEGNPVYVAAGFVQSIHTSPAGTSIRVHGLWIQCLEDPENVADQYVRAMGLEYEEEGDGDQ
jgi:uncharacterized protein YlzI (FlbEa/FlbD family)